MSSATAAPGLIADTFTILDYKNHVGISLHLDETKNLGHAVKET